MTLEYNHIANLLPQDFLIALHWSFVHALFAAWCHCLSWMWVPMTLRSCHPALVCWDISEHSMQTRISLWNCHQRWAYIVYIKNAMVLSNYLKWRKQTCILCRLPFIVHYDNEINLPINTNTANGQGTLQYKYLVSSSAVAVALLCCQFEAISSPIFLMRLVGFPDYECLI